MNTAAENTAAENTVVENTVVGNTVVENTVVLALDTSTPVLTAAVGTTAGSNEISVDAGRHTGALVPGIVTDVLAAAGITPTELTAIAVGVGPGPYTSLRAGIMFAEAAAAALDIPVFGACSLDITARGHLAARDAAALDVQPRGRALVTDEPGEFVVAADARRRELYWARYAADGTRIAGPQVDPRTDLESRWTESGTVVVTATPSAAQLVSWVLAEYSRYSREGGPPSLASTPEEWVAPSSDAAEVQVPQALLDPRPLYLRRPDAVEPVVSALVVSTPISPGAGQ